jgi:hypothetical protein
MTKGRLGAIGLGGGVGGVRIRMQRQIKMSQGRGTQTGRPESLGVGTEDPVGEY